MRYFIEFSYNGSQYHGYQIQPNCITVQEVLEERLSKLLSQEIKTIGAGRTDAGVHAKQMFAHFDYERNLNRIELIKRLNGFLPQDIAVHQIHVMKEGAHARFDAVKRVYEYQINLAKNPFEYNAGWNIFFKPLEINKMNEAAQSLYGKKDFSSFAKLHTDVKTHICTVERAEWESRGDHLYFTIAADRFLRNMVRAVVGTLVAVGAGEISVEEFKEIINKKDRNEAGASAPAQGLYLAKVEYPKAIYNGKG